MLLREHGDAIRADLVRDVTVGRDAIGADHDQVHMAKAHHRRRHVVGDHGRIDTVLHQLPRREPRALKERTRFIRKDRNLLSLLRRSSDHTESRAIARGRQRTCVAVREDFRLVGHKRRAIYAHRLAAANVLVVDRVRLGLEPLLELVHGGAALRGCGKRPLHALDGPEQIHCRRSRRGHQVAGLLELCRELLRARGAAALHAERNAHGRGDANRRGATNDHRRDGLGHFFGRLATHVDLGSRELPLVNHHNRIVFPLNRRQHLS